MQSAYMLIRARLRCCYIAVALLLLLREGGGGVIISVIIIIGHHAHRSHGQHIRFVLSAPHPSPYITIFWSCLATNPFEFVCVCVV